MKTWLAFLAPAFVGAIIAGGGCGESVATCDSVCELPDAPQDCKTTCGNTQTACSTGGCEADFQWYLTCIGNAGTYHAVDDLCADATKAVATLSKTTPPEPTDAGVPEVATHTSDSSTSACAAATCGTVCALPGADSDCDEECATTEAQCEADTGGSQAEMTAFQALLTCVCQAGLGSTSNSSCADAIQQLGELCPGVMVLQLDAGPTHP